MRHLLRFIKKQYRFDSLTTVALMCAVFAAGCAYGWTYETLFYWMSSGFQVFYWRSQTFGPWMGTYGLGALGIYLITRRVRREPVKVAMLSGVVCGLFQYGFGLLFFYQGHGLRLWNYNKEILNFGNIEGFICFRSILNFTFGGLFLMLMVYPCLARLAEITLKKRFVTGWLLLTGIIFLDAIYNYLISGFFGLPNAQRIYEKWLGFQILNFT